MSAVKAWHVQYHDAGDEPSVIVFAETRGKARAAGAGELDAAYIDCTALRAPAFDGVTSEEELMRMQLALGWWFGCMGPKCDVHVCDEDNDGHLTPYVLRGGSVYCSSACCIAQLRKERQERVSLWNALERATAWLGPDVQIFSAYQNVAGDWLLHLQRPDKSHTTVEMLADRSAA